MHRVCYLGLQINTNLYALTLRPATNLSSPHLSLPHHRSLTAGHTRPSLQSIVPLPHLPPHPLFQYSSRNNRFLPTHNTLSRNDSTCLSSLLTSHGITLPSLRVLVECSSTSEIVTFTILFLPFSQSAHVPRGRFPSGPQVEDETEKVEYEDESDCPFKSSGSRGDSGTCFKGSRTGRFGITTALQVSFVLMTGVDVRDRKWYQKRWRR